MAEDLAETVFGSSEPAMPLRRSVGARGMRTGTLRILEPRRASSLPLALIVLLAAASSAAAVIAVQPPGSVVDEPPRVELATPPLAAREPIPTEQQGVESAAVEAAERPELAPAPPTGPLASEPVHAPSAFGLDSLPVLEADETSLGIDDALDALSAPITPQPRPAARRSTAPSPDRVARLGAPLR